VCPVRGRLKVTGRSADGLTPSEEKFRVEAIRYLVEKGYPKSNFVIEPVIKRFGNGGRNSFRADFAVLDVPAEAGQSADWLLSHALVLAEIKRDNSDAAAATEFQVKPLLAFAGKDSCVAIYWDNVDQRVFWRTREEGESVLHEGPIEDLPAFGHRPGAVPMTLGKLRTETPLRSLFERIEDVLHAASIGPSKRFTVMLQLLLAKIFDEHDHDRPGARDEPLAIQDFRALRSNVSAAKTSFDELLGRAANYYKNHLPEPVPQKLDVPDPAFLETMSLLAPHKITAVKHSVIQDFYMYFAKGLYKWDLAQYFTPPSITDFIIDVLNPQWDEHVHDPACGSADFLTATFRRGQALGFQDYADHVWGSDVSAEAVQVAVLNMVLNGDGKSNIHREDSLANVDKNKDRWDAIVCNPPFGKKIVERSPATLKKFDMGCVENKRGGTPLNAQETGILFTELCVRIVRPGGRIAIVVPNGYLGNSSPKYRELRRWLLRHTRIAAVVGLPRFSFKTSGADVSTSVLFLEKREKPLKQVADVEPYDVAVQVINKVGWSLGDKKASPMYVRDQSDGAFILDDSDEMILDSDFAQVQANLRASSASQYFPWMTRGKGQGDALATSPHAVDARSFVDDILHTIDPKLLSAKHARVREAILAVPHFRLGDVVDVIPERISAEGKRTAIKRDVSYDYVELQNVESGTYRTQRVSGWALPDRARHTAEPGDFYVGGVWSSVRKWMLVGNIAAPTIVTNGMHRFRVKAGQEDYLLDIVAGLCSEAYAVQMRARARGSDGLAEIRVADLENVVLPRVVDEAVRTELWPFVTQLLQGFTTVEAKFSALAREGRLPVEDPARRDSHVMIV
jgi:type I restriction enzyme M protein